MFQIDRINSGFFLCTATYPAFLRISINMYMIFSIDGGKEMSGRRVKYKLARNKLIIFFLFLSIFTGIIYNYIRIKHIETVGPSYRSSIIVIDPGHGGVDPGAVGSPMVFEKDINLQIAKKLHSLIHEWGGIAVLTRDQDIGLYRDDPTTSLRRKKQEDLRNRIEIAREIGGRLFLSIHLNAHPSPRWYGAQVFYHKDSNEGERLARLIQEEMVRVLDKNNRRRAKKAENYYILEKSEEHGIHAVIIEAGFISNPYEERLLKDDQYQEKVAWAIFTGLMRYLFEEGDEDKSSNTI